MRKKKEKSKEYILGGEFHEIVKETLLAHGISSHKWADIEADVVAEAIEKKIKEKFHIFRINKLMTGD